jgi:formate dehydrogenase maturation protein FdhE
VTTIGALDTIAVAFERHAARADMLAHENEVARAPLAFAAGLYRAQVGVARAVTVAHSQRALTGALDLDVFGFTDGLRGALCFAAANGPPDLAEVARMRAREEPQRLHARLQAFWVDANGAAKDYLSRALLRPYVKVLACLQLRPDRVVPAGACPFCGGAPWIAARRAAPDADGAQRYLGCALCGGEWVANRLRCPACSNEDPAKLVSFQSDRHPAVRIEACETCRRYVKSLDLTVDGRLIPEVDELVSVAMDLWAAEQGYVRIEPGLAGI